MKIRAPLFPRWLRWLGVVVISTFIFYVSVLTVPPETIVDQAKPGPSNLIPLDKWRHFVAYAGLGIALAYATTDWELDNRAAATFVIGLTVIYGVGIEFSQSFIPQRYFGIGDAYANAIGGMLVLPWYFLQSYVEFLPTTEWLHSIVSAVRK